VLAAAALSTLAAASPALAREQFAVPTIHFLPASGSNYTVAHRPTSSIQLVVVHVTESSAASAISWFRNPKAQASANYVVGQDGSITEMVRDGDIAWHAGNWTINRESIGIEHGGYTYRKGTFTDTEYRASARLVASEMRHYLLPIDRKHVIGHSEVPDPNHVGLFGGFAHHTDPGPYWNWPLYMRYVKTYARGGAPSPKILNAPQASAPKAKPSITGTVSQGNRVSVSSSGLKDGATVSGYVDWQAKVTTPNVVRVEFLVDGRVRATDTKKPFSFGNGGWDTTKETNGGHVLTLRVVRKNGQAAGQSLRITVANTPFSVASANLTNGATVAKTVRWEAVPGGASADHVDFLLDGRLVTTAKSAPYLSSWDTTKADDGPHTLTLRAVSVDGRVAESNTTVVVKNTAAPPKPKPASGISVYMDNLWDGAVVSGKVNWTATVSGSPKRVEFWVDSRWRWSEGSAPWVYGGDGNVWDTTRERAGKHVVTVRAIAPNGRVADWQTFTITIRSPLTADAAPNATTMAVTSSIADGATVHGGVEWAATVNGATPRRVDFFVDGRLRHTEQSAPYEFGTWNTAGEPNGAHTLVVRATAADGSTATTTETVLVQNAAAVATVASQSVADGATVSGRVAWTVTTAGPRADRVELWVDGRLRWSDLRAPYAWTWDTTLESNGAHTLVAKAIQGANVDQRTVSVTVANAAQRVAIATNSLTSGQTLSGTVAWKVTTSGAVPDKLELFVDGALRAAGSPYTWDTTRDPDGSHVVLVRATAGEQVDQQTFSVTVRNTESVKSSSIAGGSTVSGTKTWTVSTQGPPADKVELLVDGALRATGTSYAWDTTKESEGAHTLVARVTAGSQVVQSTYAVTVRNAPTIASSTISSGSTLSGTATWSVTTSGLTPDRVEYSIDGVVRGTGASYVWDTTRDADGSHTLLVKAYAGPLSSSKTYTVTVRNAPATVSQSIADGATLSGTVGWTAATSGSRVDFSVDGTVVKSDGSSPFSYTLDTTRLSNGTHTVEVRSGDARSSATVTVSNAALTVTQNVSDGQVVSGTFTWTATPSGPVSHVTFLIDGSSAGRFTSSPYSGNLDTRRLANGMHTFAVRATTSDGATVTASASITVRN
jgi:hypothetical protein